MDVVNQAVCEQSPHVESCHVLFHKLHRTANALMKWSRRLFSNTKVLVHTTLPAILHLDSAQESWMLNENERDLRARLEKKVVALAIVERARKK
jgi:hypothetical protein